MAEQKVIRALPGEHNLADYEKTCRRFSFEDFTREFFGDEPGVNVAERVLDRNIARGLGHRVALYYDADNKRESYTFQQLRDKAARFAGVLARHGLRKGDRLGPELTHKNV